MPWATRLIGPDMPPEFGQVLLYIGLAFAWPATIALVLVGRKQK